MEEKNKVSIFVGDFQSERELNNFIREKFTEDGDIYSNLLSDLKVDFIDNQFQEVLFLNHKISKVDLKNFSYSEKFIDKIDFSEIKGNSLILLYDFNYSSFKDKPEKLRYISTFDYQ